MTARAALSTARRSARSWYSSTPMYTASGAATPATSMPMPTLFVILGLRFRMSFSPLSRPPKAYVRVAVPDQCDTPVIPG
ncbi:hypothetical protein GCM10010387_66460 [Streptomyces inusitatus]|uniref:Uncharacterized protein n=1 Tax=Streptomyces inusitatus TaxID=68221 RepID=A0A918QQM4_9ACTN|nr:hypothetical protein GCM10010387_66460 [Streptomyces inusitatus]